MFQILPVKGWIIIIIERLGSTWHVAVVAHIKLLSNSFMEVLKDTTKNPLEKILWNLIFEPGNFEYKDRNDNCFTMVYGTYIFFNIITDLWWLVQ